MNIHSLIKISQNDSQPLYAQVVEQIKWRVAAGDLPPGTVLPSIRDLASKLKVSVITIKRAYTELEEARVITTRPGKGSVISKKPGLNASALEEPLREHLNEAAKLGQLLGLPKAELQRRFVKAIDQLQKKKR